MFVIDNYLEDLVGETLVKVELTHGPRTGKGTQELTLYFSGGQKVTVCFGNGNKEIRVEVD